MMRSKALPLVAAALLMVGACELRPESSDSQTVAVRTLEVTATAYNSVPGQTSGEPDITAWGDRLEPGMRSIAVSRDLIELGLRHGVEVEIEGLPGRYVVRDKMARRWTQKIDVYMGEDVQAARGFGKRRLEIRWQAPAAEAIPANQAPR